MVSFFGAMGVREGVGRVWRFGLRLRGKVGGGEMQEGEEGDFLKMNLKIVFDVR